MDGTSGGRKALLTMIWAAAHMHHDSKEAVRLISIRAVLCRIPELQVKGEDHPVHELSHPAPKTEDGE